MSILDDWEPPSLARKAHTNLYGLKLGRQTNRAKCAQARADWIKANPKVGLWTILRDLGSPAGGAAFIACRCACGTERNVYYDSLRRGKSKGCGNCHRKKRK
jgi:hypothetical protein